MAKMYRITDHQAKTGVSSTPVSFFGLDMLDDDQAPGAYVQKVKVSAITIGQESPIMIYASTKPLTATWSFDDIITAQAVPSGGGTVWLSLKRSIKTGDTSDGAIGPVYIWANVSTASTGLSLVCEAWGRFLRITK